MRALLHRGRWSGQGGFDGGGELAGGDIVGGESECSGIHDIEKEQCRECEFLGEDAEIVEEACEGDGCCREACGFRWRSMVRVRG